MVGAEHVAWRESRAVASSRDASGSGTPVPRGITHAVDVETGQVACGRSSDGLIEFPDLDWERSAFLVACRGCRDAVLE